MSSPSAASRPASASSVAYQSASCTSPARREPRAAAGTRPPLTKAGVRTPPSQFVPFDPRSGQFEPPTVMSEPLSQAHTSSVLSHMPLRLSAAVMFATVESTVETIASKASCAL